MQCTPLPGARKNRSMKIIHNRMIPGRNFLAVNLFGVVFVKKNATLTAVDINHERIHTAQMREMLFVFFYIWYGIAWTFLLFKYRSRIQAYRHLSLEQEAYDNERDMNYLLHRKPYAWLRMRNKHKK